MRSVARSIFVSTVALIALACGLARTALADTIPATPNTETLPLTNLVVFTSDHAPTVFHGSFGAAMSAYCSTQSCTGQCATQTTIANSDAEMQQFRMACTAPGLNQRRWVEITSGGFPFAALVSINALPATECPTGWSVAGANCVRTVYTCPSGYAGPDAQNQCTNNCDSTDSITRNRTVCHTRQYSPGVQLQDCVTPVVQPNGNGCFNSCMYSITGVDRCWVGASPSEQGLHRVSCDYLWKGTGLACNPATDTPASDNPTTPSPPCPGTLGSVNGRPVCLDPVPPGGQVPMRPGQPYPGNPRAGTSPGDPSTAREPTPASGGNAGNGGGPGVTDPATGGTGAGGTTPGTGSGSPGGGGTPTPLEIEVETCGLPGKAPCKIDETGTPNGQGAFDGANQAAQDAENALKGLPNQVIADKGSTSWGFSLGLPSGCTNPPALSLPRAGINWTPDLCQFQSEFHAVFSFLWGFFTITGCVSMVRRTIAGG